MEWGGFLIKHRKKIMYSALATTLFLSGIGIYKSCSKKDLEKEPTKLEKTVEKTINIFPKSNELAGLGATSVMDGAYTKLSLIDLSTELLKRYHNHKRYKNGRHIIVTRESLEKALAKNKELYHGKEIEAPSNLQNLEHITLSYNKELSRHYFKIKLNNTSLDTIPGLFYTAIKFNTDSLCGYIDPSYQIGDQKDKINMVITSGDAEVIFSDVIKKIPTITDFKISKIDIEQKSKKYIGCLRGRNAKGEYKGAKVNLSSFAFLSVRPANYK